MLWLQVGELFPLCRTDDIEAGFYVEDDGRVNPVDATMALAKGARDHGATIIQGCEVTGVTKEAGRVTGVTTGCGSTIGAEYVVNCAGMWARQVILPILSLFTLFRPYLAHFCPVFSRFLRVSTAWPRRFQRAPSRNPGPRNGGKGTKSGELRPSFDTADANQRINWGQPEPPEPACPQVGRGSCVPPWVWRTRGLEHLGGWGRRVR